MARVRAPSIPDAPTLSSPVRPNRQLRRWLAKEFRQLRPAVAESASACAADRYRKHFDSYAHTCLVLFHGLAGSPSLRQSYAAFASCPGLVELSGLATEAEAELAVSFSQVAASNTTRPGAFLAGLLPALIDRVRQGGQLAPAHLPADLRVLDSTILRVSVRLASWLTRPDGIRVQVEYTPALDLPEAVLVTDIHTNDYRGLDQLVLDDPAHLAALAGQTLAFDLGYYSHRRFACLLAAGVHVVTRLSGQAFFVREDELPLQAPLPGLAPSRIQVQHDQRVCLGSPNNRAGAVLPGMRVVTAQVAPTPAAARRGAKAVVYHILTDRWDLTAQEVVECYLFRWQIELFFRWLKRSIRLIRLLGYSREAVELTVWLSLVVHLLCVLAAQALGRCRRSPTILAQLPFVLAQLSPADLLDAWPDSSQPRLLDAGPHPVPT